jgi:hypothetical protein
LIFMKAIIDNIMTFYDMRADVLGTLVANTEKALEEHGCGVKETTDKRKERLDDFVKGLAKDVSDMLTRFWFLKERKQRNREPMTGVQAESLVDFADFTKTLAKDIRSLVIRVQNARGRRSEKKLDKELKQIETYAKKRLKAFDEALISKSAPAGRRLSKDFGSTLSHIGKSLTGRLLSSRLNVNVADHSSDK